MKSDAGWVAWLAPDSPVGGRTRRPVRRGGRRAAAAVASRVDDESRCAERGSLEEVATADADVRIGVVF